MIIIENFLNKKVTVVVVVISELLSTASNIEFIIASTNPTSICTSACSCSWSWLLLLLLLSVSKLSTESNIELILLVLYPPN